MFAMNSKSSNIVGNNPSNNSPSSGNKTKNRIHIVKLEPDMVLKKDWKRCTHALQLQIQIQTSSGFTNGCMLLPSLNTKIQLGRQAMSLKENDQ